LRLEVADAGALSRRALVLRAAVRPLPALLSHQRLGRANAELAANDALGELLEGPRLRAEERARVALGELAGHDARAHARGEAQQAQAIRDGRAVLAEAIGERLLRVAVLLHETLERLRELDGVEILALDVLDECELERRARRDVLHDDEDLAQP